MYRLLDIGCGWGTLVAYAAKNYGCDATGVTLALNQTKFGTERIAKNGVGVLIPVEGPLANPKNCRSLRIARASSALISVTFLLVREHIPRLLVSKWPR